MNKILFLFVGLLGTTLFSQQSFSQDLGRLSGDLMLNANFFQRDTSIKASDNQLYDHLLSGGESWLGLRYSNKGFQGFLRVDAFHHSNLKNPTEAYSDFGIGAWGISQDIKDLTISAGYIYDQIGSGILFRSYEDRGLLIDNALKGILLNYRLKDNIRLKGFTGQQKNLFSSFHPIIKGLSAEGDFVIFKQAFVTPGLGVLNRTLDQENMDAVLANIQALDESKRFIPVYNMYGFTLYNTLSAGDFTWYVEGAYKTKEAVNDYTGELKDRSGNVLYSTLSYARKGLALTLSGKRTDYFGIRTSPNQRLLDGMVNWQPTIAQMRPQRLIARYTPPTQDISEAAYSANLMLAPKEQVDFQLSYTHINTLENLKLYRELYFESNIRSIPNTYLDIGVQYMQYNQDYYQFKPGVPLVEAITPFAEVTYKFTSKQSGKLQLQYMETKQDFGSWFFAGLEYSFAPNWSLAVSDMINVKPADPSESSKHYYNLFAAYSKGAHRFSLAYVKQVEGINCTGGVCRYEPAFSGLRLGITSSF